MLHPILAILQIRKDSQGDGSFGSRRSGHVHSGVDYVSSEGETVFAPISGVLTAVRPYRSGTKSALNGAHINSSQQRAELYYFTPEASLLGKQVAAGQRIGTAQNMKQFYAPGMKNHVHFELWDKTKASYIDITNLFFLT